MAEVSNLVQPIVDGKLQETKAKKNNTTGTTDLGKDQFLQLLVTQMQNQNPLEPASDTEWISQLANFSSLEAMQNMGDTMNGMSAMSMVGKYVDIVSKTDSGNNVKEQGYVDYVNVKDGKIQVSVNGKMYDSSTVVNVYDDYYLLQNGMGDAKPDNSKPDDTKPNDTKPNDSNNPNTDNKA